MFAAQMSMLSSFIQSVIQLLFPSAGSEDEVASLSAADFLARAPRRHNDTVLTKPKTVSPFVYRDEVVRTAIHLAKYRGKKSMCRVLGEALWNIYGEDMTTYALLSGIHWSVIPMPISPHKRRMRGYNQSEEIARGFLLRAPSVLFFTETDILRRVLKKESQTKTLSRRERTQNVAGSFFVSDPKRVSGKHVLLLDDVVTTGATAREAARALRSAGARRVLCIAVAH